MSAFDTIKAAYAAFGRNDPSVMFAAMDPAINWIQAEGNPLADRNPYVGPQAVGEGVFGPLLGAIDNFAVVPTTFKVRCRPLFGVVGGTLPVIRPKLVPSKYRPSFAPSVTLVIVSVIPVKV